MTTMDIAEATERYQTWLHSRLPLLVTADLEFKHQQMATARLATGDLRDPALFWAKIEALPPIWRRALPDGSRRRPSGWPPTPPPIGTPGASSWAAEP